MTLKSLDDVSLNKIIFLLNQFADRDQWPTDVLERSYAGQFSGFQKSLTFLNEIGLLTCEERAVYATNRLKCAQRSIAPEADEKRRLQALIMDGLTKSIYTPFLTEILGKATIENEAYFYQPSIVERLRQSGLRNLLIDLFLLTPSETPYRYLINNEFVLLFGDPNIHVSISPRRLASILRQQRELGLNAELVVLEYERHRLNDYPQLQAAISHTATQNAGAGYDIQSFSATEKEDVLRYIEVKAVPAADYRFYWSRNEIRTAKRFGSKYFLYLLPCGRNNLFHTKMMKIIQDPALALTIPDQTEWDQTIEIVSFRQRKPQSNTPRRKHENKHSL